MKISSKARLICGEGLSKTCITSSTVTKKCYRLNSSHLSAILSNASKFLLNFEYMPLYTSELQWILLSEDVREAPISCTDSIWLRRLKSKFSISFLWPRLTMSSLGNSSSYNLLAISSSILWLLKRISMIEFPKNEAIKLFMSISYSFYFLPCKNYSSSSKSAWLNFW